MLPYPALHRLMSLSKDSRGPDLFSERSTAPLTINRAMWTSLSSRLANSQVGLKLRLADTSKVHPSIFNQCFIQHSRIMRVSGSEGGVTTFSHQFIARGKREADNRPHSHLQTFWHCCQLAWWHACLLDCERRSPSTWREPRQTRGGHASWNSQRKGLILSRAFLQQMPRTHVTTPVNTQRFLKPE